MSLSADEVDLLVAELRGANRNAIADTMPEDEATLIEIESVLDADHEVSWREKCILHHLNELHWRLDSSERFPDPVAYCRDSDLWFVAIGKSAAYAFDRVGFDPETASSIEASIKARAEPLFGSTHVLETPVASFVSQEGIAFSVLDALTGAQSQKGLSWDLEPPAGAKILRAHGLLEWRQFPDGPRITLLRYAFGKRPVAGTTKSGVHISLEYDLTTNRSTPSRAIRLESKSTITAVISRLSAANPDLTFYAPAAFGLERPRRPISLWMWCLFGAAILAGIAIATKKVTTRRAR